MDSCFGRLWNGLLALILFIVLVVGVIWLYKKFRDTTSGRYAVPEETPRDKRKKSSSSKISPAPTKSTAVSPVSPSCAEINLLVVSKEIFRLRGNAAGEAERESAARLAQEKLEAVPSVPEHLRPGDQIVAVDGAVLEKMSAAEASALVEGKFRQVPANSSFKLRVRRGVEELDLGISFPSPASLPPEPSGAPAGIRIPDSLVQEVKKRVWSLHPYYQETFMTAAERAKLQDIMGRREATSEEYVFVTRRILGGVAVEAGAEIEGLRGRLALLEKAIAAMPPYDAVLTREGRCIEGKLKDTPGQIVTVVTPFGPMMVFRDDMVETKNSTEIRNEFKWRLDAAAGEAAAFPLLMEWAKKMGLPLHCEYAACKVLLIDPNHERARLEAGFLKLPGGRWRAGGAAPSPGGPLTRGRLRVKLEGMGFIFDGSRWYRKEPWLSGFDSLHSPGAFKWTGEGVKIFSEHEERTPLGVIGDAQSPPKKFRYPGEPRLKLFCPTGDSGAVIIPVVAPAEILECKVRAFGQVIANDRYGQIDLTITPEGGGQPVLLYSINSGSNKQFYDVTDHVAGKKAFTLTARLKTKADAFHTYARFLVSLPAEKDVFWVRGHVLKPAPEADKAWTEVR